MVKEKGRRYVLTADISQFQAAFSRANAVVRESANQMRALGRALKFDSTNLNALKMQLEMIGKSARATKTQIDSLKKQIAELNALRARAAKGDKVAAHDYAVLGGEKALNRLKVKLIEVEGRYENLQKQAANAAKAISNNNFDKSINKLNSELTEAANKTKTLAAALKLDGNNLGTMKNLLSSFNKQIDVSTNKVKLLESQINKLKSLQGSALAGSEKAGKLFDTAGGVQELERLQMELLETKSAIASFKREASTLDDAILNNNFNNIMDRTSQEIKEATARARELSQALDFDGHNIGALRSQFANVGQVIKATGEQVDALQKKFAMLQRLKTQAMMGDANASKLFNASGGIAELERLETKIISTTSKLKQFKQQASTLDDAIKNNGMNVALEKTNQEIERATKNVKQLSQAMNFKGFNTGDASLRFREMNTVIDQTTQKIRLLNQQRVNVPVNSSEFTRLTNEINKAEQEVKELMATMTMLERKQLGGFKAMTGGMEGMTKGIQNFSREARQRGMEATMSMAMPLGFGATTVAKAYGDMDSTIRRAAVAASDHSGQFQENFDLIKRTADEKSRGTKYSIQEVAAGYEHLLKSGWKLNDVIAHGSHAMDLATLSQTDLGTSSMMVTDMLAAFGAGANDSGKYVSSLNAAANASTVDIGDLYQTFRKAAPAAKFLGRDVKDLAAGAILLGNAGFKGSEAGTALNAGLAKIAANSKAKDTLKQLGVEAFDSQGKLKPLPNLLKDLKQGLSKLTAQEQVEALKNMFGEEHMDAWGAMIGSKIEDIEKAEAAVANIKDTSAKEQVDFLSQGAQGAMERTIASWNNVKAKLGEPVWGGLETLANWGIKIADLFNKLPDPVKRFTVAMLAGAAIFGPLAMAIGWTLAPIRKMYQGFTKVKNLMKGLKMAKNVKDLTDIGKAADKAGDMFDKSGKRIDKSAGRMRRSTGGLGRSIGNAFRGMGQGIGQIFKGIFDGISRIITSASRGLSTVIKGIGTGLKSAFQGVGAAARGLGQGIGASVRGIGQGLGATFRGVGQGLGATFRGVGQGAGAALRGVGTAARGAGQGVGAAFKGIGQAAKGAGQGIGAAARGIGTGIKSALQGVGTVIESIGKSIGIAARGIGEGLGAMFRGIALVNPATMLAFAAAILAVGAAIALVLTQSDGIVAIIKQLGDTASQMVDTITNAFIRATPSIVTLINTIKQAIMDVVPVIVQGITDIINAVANAAPRIAEAMAIVVDAISNGVARVVDSFSGLVSEISGLVDSIAGVVSSVGGAIKDALTGAGAAFEGFGNGVKSSLEGVGDVVESTGNAIKSGLEGVGDVIESVGTAIKDALSGAADVIRSVGESAEKAGNGFRLFAEGMKTLADIGAWDIGTTLASVADGLGKISKEKDAISGIEGSVKNLGNAFNGIGQSASTFSNSMTTIGTSLSTFKTNIEQIPNVLQNAATGFTTFSTNITQMLSSLTQAGSQVQQFTQGITQAMTGLTAGTAAMTAFNMAITMLGTGMMTAGMGVTMFGTSMTMMTAAVTAASAAMTMFSAAFTTVTASITASSASITLLTSSLTQLSSQITSVGASAMTLTGSMTALMASMTGLSATAMAATGGFTAFSGSVTMLSGMLTMASGAVTMFSGSMTMLTGALTMASGSMAMFSGSFAMVTGALTMASGTVSALSGSLSGLVGQLNGVSAAAASVSAGVGAMAATVTASFASIGAIGASTFAALVAATTSSMAAMTAAVSAGTAAMIGIMQNFASQMQSLGLQAGTQAAQSTAQGLSAGTGAVSAAGMGVLNAARGAMMGVSFVSVGSSITQGIAAGIQSGWGYLTGLVASMAASLLATAKAALGINSPSRKFRDTIGLGIPEGIQVGVERHKNLAINSVRRMATATLNAAKGVNIAGKINDTFNSTLATNTRVEHSVKQNSIVVDTLNTLIDRINHIELKSDVIMSGTKVGEITYREHQNIERRLAY